MYFFFLYFKLLQLKHFPLTKAHAAWAMRYKIELKLPIRFEAVLECNLWSTQGNFVLNYKNVLIEPTLFISNNPIRIYCLCFIYFLHVVQNGALRWRSSSLNVKGGKILPRRA